MLTGFDACWRVLTDNVYISSPQIWQKYMRRHTNDVTHPVTSDQLFYSDALSLQSIWRRTPTWLHLIMAWLRSKRGEFVWVAGNSFPLVQHDKGVCAQNSPHRYLCYMQTLPITPMKPTTTNCQLILWKLATPNSLALILLTLHNDTPTTQSYLNSSRGHVVTISNIPQTRQICRGFLN